MAIILPEKKVPRGIGEDPRRIIATKIIMVTKIIMATKIIMVTKNIMVTKMLRTVQRTWWWWTARMAGKPLSGEGRLSPLITTIIAIITIIITSPSFTAPPAHCHHKTDRKVSRLTFNS